MLKPAIIAALMCVATTADAKPPVRHVELRVSFDILQTVADCGATVDDCPDWTWSAIRRVNQLITPAGTSVVYEVIVDPSAPLQSVRLYLDGRRTNNVADESRAAGTFYYTMGWYMGRSEAMYPVEVTR